MAVKKVHQIDTAGLRRLAEEHLGESRGTAHPPGTADEPLRLLHELQVHQIELEMQNGELRQARDERDKMEAQLGKYSDLYDFAPVAYFNLDHRGIIRAVNITGTGFLGIARSLLIGRRMDCFISDETRPVFHDFLDKVFESETKETCELVLQKERHSPLVVQVKAVLSESREECRAVVIDITERKRLLDQLQLTQFCVDKAAIGIFRISDEGNIRFANEFACLSLGYTPEELYSMTIFEIDPTFNLERFQDHRKTVCAKGLGTFETVHHRKDSSTFPVEITVNYHEYQGKGFTVSFARDITERKRVEEELLLTQFCVDKASMALYQLTEEGEIWNVNECACQSLGYSMEELRSMTVFDIDPTATREVFNDLAIRTFSCGSVTFERMHRRKDGTTFPVEITANSLEFRGRRFAICFVKDITERKRVEEEVQQALEAANFVNTTMRRFVRTVAHEFRTPLGLLTGSVDVLDRYWDRLTPEKRLEQNEHIRNAARQISDLVNSVTVFNRAVTDRAGKPPQLLDIGDLCRSIAAEVETVWCAGHEFIVSLAADCGTAVIDDILFRRILQNLLTNAFRYTPTNGTVSLHVYREKDMLLLEITDTGIGIPEEDQALIFDPFYRSRNVEGRRGLGLGLSIVREALSQMGGTITMTSTTGKGTAMLVKIPVVDPV
jgi:PAS domain S-box-containing protein